MAERKWRIFISYRGDSVGRDSSRGFAERLYAYLADDPFCREKYGDVFFSPRTAGAGDNFKLDIPEVMANVSYFIMPLNRAYFADFWDEERDCPDPESVTCREIRAAMEAGSRFICVALPGFEADRDLTRKLFGDNAAIINCAVTLDYAAYRETELFRLIGDKMTREDYGVAVMGDIIRQNTPNVYMSFKRQMEAPERYPFYHKLHDVRKLTLVNFASSVFISGIQIASIYEEADFLKRWFSYHLAMGNIEADIILTDPHCAAARDAALYKMYPDGQKVPADQIILTNINKLYRFMEENPSARINLFLTDIALPYGLMITEHRNPANNHMKVDLYAPVTNDDGRRPSFYLLQSDAETADLYAFFAQNARNILRSHSYAWRGHPDVSWLRGKSIIHRAMAGPGYLPHTKRSVEACLDAGHPMEIDLLELADGQIVIGRADQDISAYGVRASLPECRASDIRKINRKAGEEKILLLREFFQLVGGRVPLLLEIKTRDRGPLAPGTERFVRRFMTELEQYLDRFIPRHMSQNDHSCHAAVHSASPYVLKLVREIDCTIPVGMISMDFSRIPGVEEDFIRMHRTASYMEIIRPDFLGYCVQDLGGGPAEQVCAREGIPLLAWTVRNAEEETDAWDYGCDNIVIEGARTYL